MTKKADSFADASDEYFAALSDGNATDNIKVTEISISRKGAQSVRSSYDSRSRKLSAELGDLQSEREEIPHWRRMRMRPISTWRERKYLMSKSMG